jgi:hypothetical protein
MPSFVWPSTHLMSVKECPPAFGSGSPCVEYSGRLLTHMPVPPTNLGFSGVSSTEAVSTITWESPFRRIFGGCSRHARGQSYKTRLVRDKRGLAARAISTVLVVRNRSSLVFRVLSTILPLPGLSPPAPDPSSSQSLCPVRLSRVSLLGSCWVFLHFSGSNGSQIPSSSSL